MAVGLTLTACSIVAPFEGKPASLVDADTTGSIVSRNGLKLASPLPLIEPVSLLSPKLDVEDWRRAKAALATALDPQGNGGHVGWDNSASGAKGSFMPAGDAFLVKDEICRKFIAMLAAKEPEQWFEGNACRISVNDWEIKDVKPGKKSG